MNKDKDRRREFIYRALIRCILASWNPDFVRAERYAKSSIEIRRTVFSLASLARVYLQWKYKGPHAGREVPDDIDALYRNALDDLERDPGTGAAPLELYAEEAEFTEDFQKAVENMDTAVAMDPDRFQLRAARWRLMVRSGDHAVAAQAVQELDAARQAPAHEAIWPSYVHALTEIYARGLIATGQSTNLANNFAPELQASGELGQMIARIRRDDRS